MPPKRPHFVMVDDLNNVFYDVDYESPDLKNPVPWAELLLHTSRDPAIVFPPNQYQLGVENPGLRITGFLVLIQSREDDVFTGYKIGTVHVQPLAQERMNWGVLESWKGPELASEVRAGLLRHVFNRRPGAHPIAISYVTPRNILDSMQRQWHKNAAALEYELDGIFAGGRRIGENQRWRLYASW